MMRATITFGRHAERYRNLASAAAQRGDWAACGRLVRHAELALDTAWRSAEAALRCAVLEATAAARPIPYRLGPRA